MFTVMLSVKLVVKMFAAAIHAACAAAAFMPKLMLKLAVKFGLITNAAKAGALNANAQTTTATSRILTERFGECRKSASRFIQNSSLGYEVEWNKELICGHPWHAGDQTEVSGVAARDGRQIVDCN